jgi:hypothetical protein
MKSALTMAVTYLVASVAFAIATAHIFAMNTIPRLMLIWIAKREVLQQGLLPVRMVFSTLQMELSAFGGLLMLNVALFCFVQRSYRGRPSREIRVAHLSVLVVELLLLCFLVLGYLFSLLKSFSGWDIWI